MGYTTYHIVVAVNPIVFSTVTTLGIVTFISQSAWPGIVSVVGLNVIKSKFDPLTTSVSVPLHLKEKDRGPQKSLNFGFN